MSVVEEREEELKLRYLIITLLLWMRLINTWQIEEDVKVPVDGMLWVILIGGSVIYPWGLLSIWIHYTGAYLENKGAT